MIPVRKGKLTFIKAKEMFFLQQREYISFLVFTGLNDIPDGVSPQSTNPQKVKSKN